MQILSVSTVEQLSLKLEQKILLKNFLSVTEFQGKRKNGHFLQLRLMW